MPGVIICFVQGENVREVGELDLGARSDRRALRIFRAANRGGDQRGRVAHLDRSRPRLLLSKFAGQRRAHPAPDAGFPEQLSPARVSAGRSARRCPTPSNASRTRCAWRNRSSPCWRCSGRQSFAHARSGEGARRAADAGTGPRPCGYFARAGLRLTTSRPSRRARRARCGRES